MPDLMTLWLANDLIAREVAAADTIYSNFGAGYEVLYRDRTGFQRVDDVMHILTHVYLRNDKTIQNFKLYPHLIRQWYEGNLLYVASLSLAEGSEQGLKSKGFIVPSVLGEAVPPERPPEELATRPKYLCIHHQFIESTIPRASLILCGETIDKYFIL